MFYLYYFYLSLYVCFSNIIIVTYNVYHGVYKYNIYLYYIYCFISLYVCFCIYCAINPLTCVSHQQVVVFENANKETVLARFMATDRDLG